MTQFDVNRSAEWTPLFTKSFEGPSDTIHDLNYVYRPSLDIGDVQRVIELKIVKKINSWRTNRKTVWNRFMNENLREILTELEKEVCFDYETETHTDKLEAIFTSYKINGYPINMPYVNLSTIVDRVKNTGIHLITDSKAEFSLAVHLSDYSCNIFSLWIFLVALIPKN